MCLIVVKPAGEDLAPDLVEAASCIHPDGTGVAWCPGDGEVHILRAVRWDPAGVSALLSEIQRCPAIVHFRWATHGARSRENTHPFRLSGDGGALAHNGIIAGVRSSPSRSDTRAFVEDELRGWTYADLRASKGEVADRIGVSNRIATIHPNGRILLFGGFLAHEGCLHSNSSAIDLVREDIRELTFGQQDDPFYWRA